MDIPHVIFASYGNDSIALIQWAYEKSLNAIIAYSLTGWAIDGWKERVTQAERWASSLGFSTVQLPSIGMAQLVKNKQAWPRGGGGKFQFCTSELKQKPALAWLDEIDPECEAICLIGIRREESFHRSTFPEWTEQSPLHGNRRLWAPLVRHSEEDRNGLLAKTPFTLLPHRSRECYPCVNARKAEIAALPESKIAEIERMEQEAGTNGKGNPRVMFSPKKSGGAIGIRQVVKWAKGPAEQLMLGGCDGGWCGA